MCGIFLQRSVRIFLHSGSQNMFIRKQENIYRQIKDLLQKKEKVLFISLPCKVAGLYSFLGGKLEENLLTVDIVLPWGYHLILS